MYFSFSSVPLSLSSVFSIFDDITLIINAAYRMRLSLCWCPCPSRAICRVSRNAGPTLVIDWSPILETVSIHRCINRNFNLIVWTPGDDVDCNGQSKDGPSRGTGTETGWWPVKEDGGWGGGQEIVPDEGWWNGGCNFHSLNLRREEITFGRCNWRIGCYSRMGIIDCSREFGYFPCEKVFENVLPIVPPSSLRPLPPLREIILSAEEINENKAASAKLKNYEINVIIITSMKWAEILYISL